MSFTSDVKSELCRLARGKCCQRSEAYGLLFFSNKFSKSGINFNTESLDTAQLFEKRLSHIFNVSTKVKLRSSFKNSNIYEFKISADSSEKILNALCYDGIEEKDLVRSVFDRGCCLSAFLRGAFLSCGTVQNPSNEYRLSFTFQDIERKGILKDILTENGFSPKERIRGNLHILYFKDSESIEDLLTFLGAQNSSLLLMNEKIYKDIRNNINRAKNCDSANIDRTLNAVEKQISAIKFIEEKKGLIYLPEELKKVAVLRLENPESPLSELCRLFDEPISKSGINHRLRKIIDIAEKLKQE